MSGRRAKPAPGPADGPTDGSGEGRAKQSEPGAERVADPAATRLRVLVGLVALEAVAMAAVAIGLAVALVADRTSTQTGFVVAEVGFAAVVAAVLALIASGLRRQHRWAQGLGVTLQLFSLPFGVRLAQFGYWWAAIPMLAVVLAALVLLFGLEQPPGPEPE